MFCPNRSGFHRWQVHQIRPVFRIARINRAGRHDLRLEKQRTRPLRREVSGGERLTKHAWLSARQAALEGGLAGVTARERGRGAKANPCRMAVPYAALHAFQNNASGAHSLACEAL